MVLTYLRNGNGLFGMVGMKVDSILTRKRIDYRAKKVYIGLLLNSYISTIV